MPYQGTTRRTVLTGVGSAGLVTALSGILPEPVTAQTNGKKTQLGSFESGLDGWRTNGGNDLSRISREERPFAIEGGYGLQVTVQGDSYPMIENTKRVKDADFKTHPYLFATITPSQINDTESTITVAFRLHYSKNGGSGSNGQEAGDAQKSVLVEESDEIIVQPFVKRTITWDMSGIDKAKRANAKRLEIVWYPTDHPPDHGPRGRGSGFDYQGDVLFDDIHLGDSGTELSAKRMAEDFRDLQFEHGQYQETEVTSRDSDSELGQFIFSSGVTVKYSFEIVADEQYELTIGETTYRFGGGWE